MTNTNMRRGFTMIELVFVIVIIGILAAVALPRFTGISDDAHVSKLQAFTGTLNRTTGPSKWSNLQRQYPTVNGNFADATVAADVNITQIREGVDVESIPSEFATFTTAGVIDLTKCAPANTTIPKEGQTGAAALGGVLATTTTIGNTTYALACAQGSLNTSPRFFLYDTKTDKVVTR